MLEVKYPNIIVGLLDKDGNAFAILGAVKKALKAADVPQSEIDLFLEEASAGDYDHLLQTVMKWVTIESDDEIEEDDEQDDYGYAQQGKSFD